MKLKSCPSSEMKGLQYLFNTHKELPTTSQNCITKETKVYTT